MAWNLSTNAWTCLVCQKELANKGNTRRHIEMYHLPNQDCQCSICGKWYSNDYLMRQHIRRTHNKF